MHELETYKTKKNKQFKYAILVYQARPQVADSLTSESERREIFTPLSAAVFRSSHNYYLNLRAHTIIVRSFCNGLQATWNLKKRF